MRWDIYDLGKLEEVDEIFTISAGALYPAASHNDCNNKAPSWEAQQAWLSSVKLNKLGYAQLSLTSLVELIKVG